MAGHDETIVAVATSPGRGGIGIVRISGSLCPHIAGNMLNAVPAPRTARYGNFLDADSNVIDQGISLYYPAPASFTGEDCLELHGHGSAIVLDQIVKRACELGARPAQPGEFSQRAFLNGKIDLTQAEAIADLINSQTDQAARCAIRALQGVFSSEIQRLLEELISLRAYIEAALDFPDDEIELLSEGRVVERLYDLSHQLEGILQRSHQGRLLNEGIRLVIAGRPNAGKSSLLNRLAGHQAAIVTDIPGTTRDTLHCDIQIDGLPVHLVDTAGLRDSSNRIEQEGVKRAKSEIEQADMVLFLIDGVEGLTQQDDDILHSLPEVPVILAWNKVDRLSHRSEDTSRLYISALSGTGIDELIMAIKERSDYKDQNEGSFIARQRHLVALGQAQQSINEAIRQANAQGNAELIAEDLRQCQRALGEITGEFSSEDLLGKIFSSFCIGK